MVYQFYVSFQRTSFWLCWFFAMVSFVSFAFISALIFKISFLLVTLGFFISSFSSCFRCRVRLFFWIFLISWGKPLLLWTFPLALLIVSHRLSVIVFSFSLLLHAYFDFFFDFFCDLLVIQKRVVQPPYVGFFNSFSPVIEISSYCMWSEKMLGMISIFLNLPRLALWPRMWSILEKIPCALEKKVKFIVLGWNVL